MRRKLDYRFTFFAALEALFWAMVCPGGFVTVFMQDQGFTNAQMGIGLAMINVASLIFLPIWGMIADKLGSKRKTLIILYFGVGISAIFTAIFTGNPWLSIFLMFTVIIFRGSVASLTDSWVITEVNTPDLMGNRINYGPIRASGSIGYAIAGFIYYYMFTGLKIDTRWQWLCSTFFAIPCILLASGYKEQAVMPGAASRRVKSLSMKELKPGRLLKNYYFVTFFIIYMLFNIPGYLGLSYISQLLRDLGEQPVFVGVLGSIRALCEVPLLFFSQKIIKKLGYKKTLFIIGSALCIEQVSYVVCNAMWQVIAFQILHGAVNGLLVGSAVGYIFSLVPPELSATAQTFCGASCSALTIIGNLLSGWIIDTWGVRAIFVITTVSMLLAIVLFAITLLIGKIKKIQYYDAKTDPVSQSILQKLYSAE